MEDFQVVATEVLTPVQAGKFKLILQQMKDTDERVQFKDNKRSVVAALYCRMVNTCFGKILMSQSKQRSVQGQRSRVCHYVWEHEFVDAWLLRHKCAPRWAIVA
jgi:hypothetical protein